MIDIHCHIVPGVDDGSRSCEMSLNMLKQAYAEGITAIIATPHYRRERWEYHKDEIREKVEILKEKAKARGIPVELYVGSELRWRESLPEQLREGRCLTMADSDYALIEFASGDSVRTMDRALRNLLMEGFRPVIAHVERYEALRKELDSIQEWIEQGILIQCNASAVAGKDGFKMSYFTHKLLSNDMVHFIATDSHSDTWRHPDMEACLKYLQKKCGNSKTEQLLVENPGRIIRNEYI